MVSSRWARLGGAIVDYLVVAGPLAVLLVAFAPSDWFGDGDGWPVLLDVSVYGLVALVLFAGYNIALISRPGEHNGQTFGKQLAGTRVVRRDGGPIAIRTAVVREVGRSLLGILPLLSLADSLAIFLPLDRRTLHDLAGGTLVVSAGWFPRAAVGASRAARKSVPPAG